MSVNLNVGIVEEEVRVFSVFSYPHRGVCRASFIVVIFYSNNPSNPPMFMFSIINFCSRS